jgi:hypothetical protein
MKKTEGKLKLVILREPEQTRRRVEGPLLLLAVRTKEEPCHPELRRTSPSEGPVHFLPRVSPVETGLAPSRDATSRVSTLRSSEN